MDKEINAISKYRLEKANVCIKSAETLVRTGDYKGAANRAYFRKNYIKTGVFNVEYSDIIKEAFDVRSDSDYDDFFIISKSEVEEQIENAKKFYDVVSEYLIARGVE